MKETANQGGLEPSLTPDRSRPSTTLADLERDGIPKSVFL
jgi:hypothetical protein